MDPLQGNTSEPLPSDSVFTKLQRIAALAEQMPQTALRTLSHCLDRELLWYANRLVRPDAAVGVEAKRTRSFRKACSRGWTSLLMKPTKVRIGRLRFAGLISRKARGMKPALWGFRRSRIRSCSVGW